MRNNLDPREDDAERPRRSPDPNAPLSDREVPLTGLATTDVINRWLDGEIPEPTAQRGDAARHIEFWRRIGEETEHLRHTVTPAHVPAQIMAAIQQARTPELVAADPWYRRTVEMSTMSLILAGVALLAAGALVATLLR